MNTIGRPDVLQDPVSQYMSKPVFSIDDQAPLSEVERRLKLHKVTSLAVTGGNGALEGVVSLTDLLEVAKVEPGGTAVELPDQPASSIMTREVVSVQPSDTLATAASLMMDRHVHRVFVAQSERVIGVLSTKDLSQVLLEARVTTPISVYMTTPVVTLGAGATLGEGVARLKSEGVRALVVMGEGKQAWPVGIFTKVEALKAAQMQDDTPLDVVMSHRVLAMGSDTALHHAAAHVAVNRVRRVVVVEDGRTVGIVTGLDFARAIVREAGRA